MDAKELLSGVGSIAEMEDRVYGYLLATRENKFKKWICGIKILKRLALLAEKLGLAYFKDAEARIEMFEAIYLAPRVADDRADGDLVLDDGTSASMFIDRLIALVKTGGIPGDLVERLLAYAFHIGDRLGMDMRTPVLYVLRSLRFDAARRESPILVICDEKELGENYDLCDIKGVVIGCLITAREDVAEWKRIAPLARAMRIRLNIRDLDDEMGKDLCNISKQDVKRFQITDVRQTHSPGVRRWKHKEAWRAVGLLDEYRRRMQGNTLHPITKRILYWAFERPTKKSLRKILKSLD